MPLFRHTPWLLDRLWESPQLIRAVAGRAVQTEPETLGDLTVSVLEGTNGRQSKEIDKLVHWLRGQPKPDVVDISNSMLIALARPLKEALGAPVCCTLQGEDIFLSRLDKAHRERCIALIAEHARYVDRFVAVSDYCAERMCRFPRHTGREDRRRPARHQRGRVGKYPAAGGQRPDHRPLRPGGP